MYCVWVVYILCVSWVQCCDGVVRSTTIWFFFIHRCDNQTKYKTKTFITLSKRSTHSIHLIKSKWTGKLCYKHSLCGYIWKMRIDHSWERRDMRAFVRALDRRFIYIYIVISRLFSNSTKPSAHINKYTWMISFDREHSIIDVYSIDFICSSFNKKNGQAFYQLSFLCYFFSSSLALLCQWKTGKHVLCVFTLICFFVY